MALNDDERKRLRLLNNRSEAVRGPLDGFSISPLPERIAKIDPAGSARWLQDNNERIKEFMSKLNTGLPV